MTSPGSSRTFADGSPSLSSLPSLTLYSRCWPVLRSWRTSRARLPAAYWLSPPTAIIAVGGLNQYAAGNRARLVRQDRNTGQQREYNVKLGKLLKDGDPSANVRLEPGDVIIIPESMF